METASFVGILKTLFYIVLFYYLFKFAMRWLLPILLKKAVQNAEEHLKQRSGQQYRQTGETSYSYPNQPSDKPRETKKVGEYVDFEEIE